MATVVGPDVIDLDLGAIDDHLANVADRLGLFDRYLPSPQIGQRIEHGFA